jgi:uncharacterized metal-binding protein
MADGRTHALATKSLAVLLFAGQMGSGLLHGYSMQETVFSALALLVGTLGGLFLTPDLDIDAGSMSEEEVRKISPFGENIWWIYWFPYRWLIPHRSPLSHWPIIGTLGRLLYLSIPYLTILAITFVINQSAFGWLAFAGLWLLFFQYFQIAVLGLASSDLLHFFMDRHMFHKIFKQRRIYTNIKEHGW